MQLFKHLPLIAGILHTFCLYSLAWAADPLPEHLAKMMDWEFDKNGMPATGKYKRIGQLKEFQVEYYEVPEKYIQASILPGTDDQLIQSLRFEKDGVVYYRWFINPEDTLFHKEVEAFLEFHGLPKTRHQFGYGRLSASRTCLAAQVGDEKEQSVFFFKSSTNNTGGSWHNKKVDGEQTQMSTIATQITQAAAKTHQLKSLVTLEEPITLSLKGKYKTPDSSEEREIDQGVIIRSLGDYAKSSEHTLLPGFSAIHESEGAALAKLDEQDPDRNNPSEYWRKHFAAPVGRAMAELLATRGLNLTSAHAQQFLIELDQNHHPTGRIISRDFADSDLVKSFFNGKEDEDIVAKWSYGQTVENSLQIIFAFFTGSPLPNWISKEDFFKWGETFYQHFNQRFEELTGVKLERGNKPPFDYEDFDDSDSYGKLKIRYSRETLEAGDSIWRKWLAAGRCFRGMETLPNGLLCSDVMDCYGETLSHSKSGLPCDNVMMLIYENDPNKVSVEILGQLSLLEQQETCVDGSK